MELTSPSTQRVLLGFKDAVLEEEASSWNVSKIGGLPDILPNVTLQLPTCALCSAVLCHVAQVYCPLEGSPFHRVIHMFACIRKQCWGKHGSWVALRSQSLEEEKPQIKEQPLSREEQFVSTDWCEDADNWGIDSEESLVPVPASSAMSHEASSSAVPPHTDCISQLQDLTLSDRTEGVQSGVSMFPSYYVAVADEEECAWDKDLDHAHRLLKEYEKQQGLPSEEPESCEGKGDNEKYEKSNLESRDLVFHKFLKRISPCRQQILRYSWNGAPLYMSPLEAGSQFPPCAQCGGRRVFEFQLMPALVNMLQSSATELLLEFGTILVFTCERSCWSTGDRTPVQEFCIVQEDPDQRLFN
ncbi:programmed cell death protein 2-like [Rhinophrynus dorsalis]